MSIMPPYFVPHALKTSVVKIYSYQDKTLNGILSNPYYQKDMPFFNLIQFLFLMDHMLSRLQYPQESFSRRTFESHTASLAPLSEKTAPIQAPLATFIIHVIFRQNASWQGDLVWAEREKKSQFRSVLELVLMMDNALTVPAKQ